MVLHRADGRVNFVGETKTLSMKKISRLYLLLFAGAVIAPSCKKRRLPHPLSSCNITRVAIVERGSTDTLIYNVNYNQLGLVTSVQTGTGANLVLQSNSYADTNEVVTYSIGGSISATNSVTLGSNGLMLDDIRRLPGSSDVQATTFFYSGTEVVGANILFDNVPPPDINDYTWSAGNLTNFVPEANISTTSAYFYTYNSDAAAMGDYHFITQLLTGPAPTIRTVNQVASVQQMFNLQTITYSHLADGRISGFTVISTSLNGGSPPDTVDYTYQYACGLPGW